MRDGIEVDRLAEVVMSRRLLEARVVDIDGTDWNSVVGSVVVTDSADIDGTD